MLVWGALVGTAGALVAQVLLRDHVNADTEGLMRFAMLVPVGMYVVWWMLSPGISVGQQQLLDEAALPEGSPAAERAEEIAETFDQVTELSDTRFSRVSVDIEISDELRDEYAGSLRRPADDEVAALGFPGSLGHARKRRGA
jgi:hypothetical protein